MVRGAAGDDHDPAQVADLELAQGERVEQPVPADAVADRLGHGLRLLPDLLEHEGLVAALLGALVVPVDLLRLGCVDLRAVGEAADALGSHLDHLAVAWMEDDPGLAEKRRDRGGEEVLAVAEPDDERRLVPDAGEQVRLVVVDRHDREVALELRVDAGERLREIAVVLLLEKVDDDLGVGLRREGMAAPGELLLQLHVVLDDPVEDDRQPRRVAAGERMGVLLGHGAVRRPARVAEPVPRA